MRKSLRVLAFTFATLLVVVGYASAIPYGFNNITNNNAVNAAAGEAQLGMDVTESGGNVLFTFVNSGPLASSITDIYFDDDAPFLLNFISFNQSIGVSFAEGAAPPNLSGGSDLSFTSNYAYDSNAPVQPSGVNPGESLGIVFSLTNGNTFGDIIAALENESMRVGLHVQGFANEGSESFINNPNPDPTNPVPEPGTMILLGAGFLGLAIYGKRRMNS